MEESDTGPRGTERESPRTPIPDEPLRVFETLLGNLPGMVYRCRNDPSWTMEFVSDACLGLTGYEPECLIGNRDVAFADLIHQDDQARVWSDVQRCLAERRAFQLEYRILTRSGDQKWVWEQGSGVFDRESGELGALEGYIVDVSHYRTLEDRLLQAAKMEAVGRLAGGIAHDFNNMLTVILGSVELLLLRAPATDASRTELVQVREAAERASKMTRQLLAFSRQQFLQPHSIALGDVVAGLEPMLRRLIGEDIELTVQRQDDLGRIFADASKLEQVVVNLAVNARDAMPDGGRISLEVQNVELGADYIKAHPEATPGSHVMLRVSDTGVGMSPDVAARIFEPFFSTKRPGTGTGLGLSTLYGFVRQSGGHISVESEPGAGTTFELCFPRVSGEPPPAELPREPESHLGLGEVVLLVEDDELVRGMTGKILMRAGYEVVAAASPLEALDLVRGGLARLDLLLTDVVMPGMTGSSLAEELAKLRPGLRTLFMSGYSEDAVLQRGALSPGVGLVAKPFLPDGLLSEVRRAIDAHE